MLKPILLTDQKIGIGLMSGTSTDGLDIAACKFFTNSTKLEYEFIAVQTIPYTAFWKNRLLFADQLSGRELRKLDIDFALFMADSVSNFLATHPLKPDFLSSHGHTVFHQPQSGYTLQIGSGATLAAKTGITTVCDFRQGDISLGGQGAPLVPTGDELLFGEYDCCLNLGGFANVSYRNGQTRLAFDICALNVVMNKLARTYGKEFDENGDLAKTGQLIPDLLLELNRLSFYAQSYPKSLGTEWVVSELMPIIDRFNASDQDKLTTFTEHAASQISNCISIPNLQKVLVTGGGAWNNFLVDRIQNQSNATIVVPERNLVEHKESLIFALLGLLRLEELSNTMNSVTGASRAMCSGAVYFP
jgi:anhydro-N-acetylmuramic acid kinase